MIGGSEGSDGTGQGQQWDGRGTGSLQGGGRVARVCKGSECLGHDRGGFERPASDKLGSRRSARGRLGSGWSVQGRLVPRGGHATDDTCHLKTRSWCHFCHFAREDASFVISTLSNTR